VNEQRTCAAILFPRGRTHDVGLRARVLRGGDDQPDDSGGCQRRVRGFVTRLSHRLRTGLSNAPSILAFQGQEIAMLIEGAFDSRTLANMNVALDRVCEKAAHGEDHLVRKRVARQIIKCARSGKTTLGELTAAGQRGLITALPTPKAT